MVVACNMASDASTIFSIHYDGKRFGCAYFMNSECLVLGKDSSRINMDLISKLSHESGQCKVLTSSQSKIAALKAALWADPDIELIPASEFAAITLAELEAKFNISIVNDRVDCKASLQALHALLNYLSRSDLFVFPSRVEVIKLDTSRVVISKDCLEALQIFNVQSHPNMHIQTGQKEGLSIYKLFQNCVSEEGRRKFRSWFSHPICDLDTLNNRMNVVETLNYASFQSTLKGLTKNLKRIQNIKKIVEELKFSPSPTALLKISNTIEAGIQIQMLFNDQRDLLQGLPFFESFMSLEIGPFAGLSRLIRRVIDHDHVGEGDIFAIREHVDEELDTKRRQYNGLSEFLNSVVDEIATEIKEKVPEAVPLNIVYFPQLGFLVTLPQAVQPDGYELQFQSDRTCYYKNERMRELDADIGDVYGEITDIQLEILQGLVSRVVELSDSLCDFVDSCSDLDCYLTLANAAKHYDLVRPELTTDAVLQVEDGRHLLVELVSPNQFIPNDCNLSDQSMIILTGANSSGKSIYLKQMGIITYLAHIGSFVPAKKAKIGIVDKILTRIKTAETLAQNQSAFAADLKQVKMICESATPKSLILIDEFGKGTSQNDGMGLFSGLLDFFGSKERHPRLIAITHMHEIFKRGLLQTGQLFKYAHMKVVMDQKLCYLYRLEEGMAEQSYAIECARDSGLSESVLSKATMFKSELEKGTSPYELYLKVNGEEAYKEALNLINDVMTQIKP